MLMGETFLDDNDSRKYKDDNRLEVDGRVSKTMAFARVIA